MIPWRDHSFLSDEDDIMLVEYLKSREEEPVTARQFYELYLTNYDPNTEPSIIYFDNLSNDLTFMDKNHVLLFLILLGSFTTTLGFLLFYKSLTLRLLCGLLVLFGFLDISLQSFEMIKNEDTSTEEADKDDQIQRIMFLVAGVLMIALAPLLFLFCSV